MDQGFSTLDQLPIGQSAVVNAVGGDRQVSGRLMEMGLLPGTRVDAIRRAPLGDPLEIRLRGYSLSLRLADAGKIELLPESASVVSPVSVDQLFQFPTHEDKVVPTTHIPRILVAGNANSGKTTIFNALTGSRAQVGNYPGVTVTRASRRVTLPGGTLAEICELPGTYSLSAHSPDEQVAVDAVHGRLGGRPDAVVVVVDAGSFERSLYLVLQIAETGVPIVMTLNMIDEATASGINFDTDRLSSWLGVPVVSTVASRGVGLDELREVLSSTLRLAYRNNVVWTGFSETVEQEILAVEESVAEAELGETAAARRSWALWSLLSDESDDGVSSGIPRAVRATVAQVRRRAAEQHRPIGQEIIGARYKWIENVTQDVRTTVRSDTRTWTNRIDSVLTHRVAGMAVFDIVMAVLFEALFSWSEPLIG